MKMLFVFGPEDGQWIDVPEGRDFFKVAERMASSEPVLIESYAPPEVFSSFLYKRSRLSDGKTMKTFEIMVLADSGKSLIEALINGYRAAS